MEDGTAPTVINDSGSGGESNNASGLCKHDIRMLEVTQGLRGN